MTTTPTPHTPEPWSSFPLAGSVSIVTADDFVCAVAVNNAQDTANAARIVTCVNACAGLNDPAADIARLRKIAAWACALVADIDGGDSVNLTDALDTVRPLLSFEED